MPIGGIRLIGIALLGALVVGCGQPIVVQQAPPQQPPPQQQPMQPPPMQPQTVVRNYPTWAGKPVDWCENWATNCGWGGAHRYCAMSNFTKAVSWKTYKPGSTWVIGSQQACNGPACTGFSQVVCQK